MIKPLICLVMACAGAAAAEWSAAAEVQHDAHRVAAYRARLAGDVLAVQVTLEPGWHTFALDNQKRAEEKLAGKKSLGIDQPTEIKAAGVNVVGPWYQSPPKDFSKAELRWYAWGFEGQATFAAHVRRPGAGPVKLTIRGQACTDSVCKNVDVELAVNSPAAGAKPDVDFHTLVPAR